MKRINAAGNGSVKNRGKIITGLNEVEDHHKSHSEHVRWTIKEKRRPGSQGIVTCLHMLCVKFMKDVKKRLSL